VFFGPIAAGCSASATTCSGCTSCTRRMAKASRRLWRDQPGRAVPWCRRKLFVEQVPVVVHHLEDLRPTRPAMPRSEADGSPSNLAVPIRAGASVASIMVIHWVREECRFPENLTSRLRVLGEMMANALQRKQALEALVASEERLDRPRRRQVRPVGPRRHDRRHLGDAADAPHLWAVGPTSPPLTSASSRCCTRRPRARPGVPVSGAGGRRAVRRAVPDRAWRRNERVDSRDRPPDGSSGCWARRWTSPIRCAPPTACAPRSRRCSGCATSCRARTSTCPGVASPRHRRGRGGSQPAVRRALELAQQVAPTNATVLLTGETGTARSGSRR